MTQHTICSLGTNEYMAGLGNIVRTSGGDIYIVCEGYTVALGHHVTVRKSVNAGVSWSLVANFTPTNVWGGGTYIYPDCILDANDIIHIVVTPGSDSSSMYIRYCQLDTSNDSFTSWQDVVKITGPNGFSRPRLDVDSNNVPFLAYEDYPASMGSNYCTIRYTNRTGGSWSSYEQPVAAPNWIRTPDIVLDSSDNIWSVYFANTGYAGYLIEKTSSWQTPTSFDTRNDYNGLPLLTVDANDAINCYLNSYSSTYISDDGTDIVTDAYNLAGFQNQRWWVIAYNGKRYLCYPKSDGFYFKIYDSSWGSAHKINSLSGGIVMQRASKHHNIDGHIPVAISVTSNGFYYDDGIYLSDNLSITPTPASASASGVDPTVDISAGNTVTPAARTARASTVNPTVAVWLIVSPNAAEAKAIAKFPDPQIKIGYLQLEIVTDVEFAPTPSTAPAITTGPTVVLGSMTVTPDPAIATAIGVDPNIAFGDISIIPSPAIAGTSSIDPTLIMSSMTVIVSPAVAAALTQIGDAIQGSLLLTPTPTTTVALTIDPTVVEGGLYYGIIKYWDGSQWVKALVKVYASGSWQSKGLKLYSESAWQDIDANG